MPLTPLGPSTSALSRTFAPRSLAVPRARGRLVFTWDDNFSDWMTEVAAVAARYNQRHTFFIQTNQIGQASRLSAADIAALHAAGHEIGSHGVTHANIPTLAVADRVTEYEQSKATLEAIVGAGQVTSFAWPFGADSSGALSPEIVGRYDRSFRVAGNYAIAGDGPRPWRIGRLNWDNTNTSVIRGMVRFAQQNDVTIVILCHDPGAATYPTVSEVAEVLNLAGQLGVPCVTAAEAFPSWNTVPNISFEEGDLDGWTKTLTGAGTAAAVTDTPATGLPGTKSAKLVTTQLTDKAIISAPVVLHPTFGTWAIQCRARVNIANAGTGGVFAEVLEYHVGTGLLATSSSTAITSTSWTTVTKTFTANARTSFAVVQLRVENCVAEAWFDHVSVGSADHVSG